MTNYERIKGMGQEELAKFLSAIRDEVFTPFEISPCPEACEGWKTGKCWKCLNTWMGLETEAVENWEDWEKMCDDCK